MTQVRPEEYPGISLHSQSVSVSVCSWPQRETFNTQLFPSVLNTLNIKIPLCSSSISRFTLSVCVFYTQVLTSSNCQFGCEVTAGSSKVTVCKNSALCLKSLVWYERKENLLAIRKLKGKWEHARNWCTPSQSVHQKGRRVLYKDNVGNNKVNILFHRRSEMHITLLPPVRKSWLQQVFREWGGLFSALLPCTLSELCQYSKAHEKPKQFYTFQ